MKALVQGKCAHLGNRNSFRSLENLTVMWLGLPPASSLGSFMNPSHPTHLKQILSW